MSKTLHHGLEILELLTSYPHGLSVTDIADGVGVHRTVAHRLIRTLEAHHLCRKDSFKRVTLGAGLVTLAEPVEQDLRTLARPILQELAEATEATAHLVVRESDTEVRALMVVEPRSAKVHVAFHPGQVDPIDRGSAGLSILASLPPTSGEREEVTAARARGYAVTVGEVIPSVLGISAVIPGPTPRRHLQPRNFGLRLRGPSSAGRRGHGSGKNPRQHVALIRTPVEPREYPGLDFVDSE